MTLFITNLLIQTAKLRIEFKKNIPYILQRIRFKRCGCYITGIDEKTTLSCAKLLEQKQSNLFINYSLRDKSDPMDVANLSHISLANMAIVLKAGTFVQLLKPLTATQMTPEGPE